MHEVILRTNIYIYIDWNEAQYHSQNISYNINFYCWTYFCVRASNNTELAPDRDPVLQTSR